MSGRQQQLVRADDYCVTARFYDLLYAEQSQLDLSFYLKLASETSGPVLELGCGTGRVALTLARAGSSVTGLDRSPAMLAQFKAKLDSEPADVRERVTLVEGDMTEFELKRQYGLILAPFRAFQHVLDTADQRRCLTCIARHLAPAGRFVYNAFEPKYEYIVSWKESGPVWRLDLEKPDGTGGVIRRYHTLEADTIRQVHLVRFKYEVYDAHDLLTETAVEVFEMRWQNRYEARYLLELCGLAVEQACGGYDRRPMDDRLGELIYVCKRA